MQATVKRGYEAALRWEPESIDVVLDGGEPTNIAADFASPTPGNARPSRDSIVEVSVRAGRDETGFSVTGTSVAMSIDGETGSRMELRYWPGEGREVHAGSLAPVIGDAHRAALRETTPTMSRIGGDGNADDKGGPAPIAAVKELSALDDEMPAAAKTGDIEESGEFNT